jgi:predicted nuclease of predicted toxin-antitoxin system
MKITADESVDFGIITKLRQLGFIVFSIAEEEHGISDDRVIEIAVNNQSLLITEDKDFGELTFRLKQNHCGILLIRLSGIPRYERIKLVEATIAKHFQDLQNKFSVLTKSGLRIKSALKY